MANPDSTALKLNKDERNQLNVTNNLRIIPGTIGNVEIGVKYLFDTPVYWQLPKRFYGDKVGSKIIWSTDLCYNSTYLLSKVSMNNLIII